MPAPLALSLLLGTFPFEPASVPARGHQETVVRLDRAAMVHLSAKSGRGTTCTVVDHLRGPFASAGELGRKDCELDLLLDAGEYKLRLESPSKGKGLAKGAKVTLSAEPFGEQNSTPVRLEPGRTVDQELPLAKQASYWIHRDSRGPVTVRVAGRTAGLVRLWRGGEWLEEIPMRDLAPSPRPGQAIHEWWLGGDLEAGDYLLTAYGAEPLAWSNGKESNGLTVELGFPAPDWRYAAATLPASGFAGWLVPKQAITAVLTALATPEGPVQLAAWDVSDSGAVAIGDTVSCRVEAKAIIPECAARAWSAAGHVLVVRGPPGTPIELRWAPHNGYAYLVDGEYTEPTNVLPLEDVPAGNYLVGIHDAPSDRDASPLGCQLTSDRGQLGRDYPRLGKGATIHRTFNYGGHDETIWFDVVESGRYRVATGGERKTRCELFRLQGEEIVAVNPGRKAEGCDSNESLSTGSYGLRLYGGSEGIERVILAPAGDKSPRESPPRTACLIQASITPHHGDRLLVSRTGAIAARGLILRPLPLSGDEPLPLELQPGEPLRLPVVGGKALTIRSAGGAGFSCGLGSGATGRVQNGLCVLPVRGNDTLVLSAPGQEPVPVWVGRLREPPPALPPLKTYRPDIAPLPRLAPDTAAHLDFDTGQSHSLVFEVKAAGLWEVGTEGLLATSCALRTPTVPALASDAKSGRGRNCLVSAYLNPGRYLVTVTAQGRSKGRAAVLLAERAVKNLPGVAGGGEHFFRVPAGELVRQKLTVGTRGRHALSTVALGATLQCRLEDRDGWPVLRAPTSCEKTLRLATGELFWTQLPLTVESMRHTRLERLKPPVVLRGNKPHPVELQVRHDAELGKDGKDEFLFELPAELPVNIALTNGMQGRIYRQGDDRALEVIPPTSGPTDYRRPEYPEGEGDGDAPEAEPPPPEEGGEAMPEGMVEGEEPQPAPPPRYGGRRRGPTVQAASKLPGKSLHLPAGKYRLVAEHSRGDVAIRYALQIWSEVLSPGVTEELAVPARVTVRVPRPGTLRLRTRGESDVRCRLFDTAGTLVAESSEVGDDWNCAFAEPVPGGDYDLVIESETQQPGLTRLTLAEPPPSDVGVLTDGKSHALGAGVLTAEIPAPPADALVQVSLSSSTPFSCAVEDPVGGILHRDRESKLCQVILRPGPGKHRLRAWTLERPGTVEAHLTVRPIVAISGRIPDGKAGRASVPRAGRFATGEGVRCLPDDKRGALRPCGPETSLEAGPVVFAALSGEPKVLLSELTADVAKPRLEKLPLESRPYIERQVAPRAALHLAWAKVAFGERASPRCDLEGGVHELSDEACFAAAGPAEAATLRLSADGASGLAADVARRAVVLSSTQGAILPGRASFALEKDSALYSLPRVPARLSLTLPPEAWAVVLRSGKVLDLCPPSADVGRCQLGLSGGGELFVLAPGERRFDAELVALSAAPEEQVVTGLWESERAAPGSMVLRVPPAAVARSLEVEGASRCSMRLSDGGRSGRCQVALPPGSSAEVHLDHPAGPLRALVAMSSELVAARFGRRLPAGNPAALPAAFALPLAGQLVDRGLTLEKESVVHIVAGAGVCRLQGEGATLVEGLGGGCAIHRLLPAGTHRLTVRPFGDSPLSGTVHWTAEPVEALPNGVGPERWIGPGEARIFRFQLASKGRVGLGLRETAEVLDCALADGAQRTLGEGCQQYLELEAGSYLLLVRSPASAPPLRFRPVLLGLEGAKMDVPEEYLRDLFTRIGANP